MLPVWEGRVVVVNDRLRRLHLRPSDGLPVEVLHSPPDQTATQPGRGRSVNRHILEWMARNTTSVVDKDPHGSGTFFLDPDPELLFRIRIQQYLKEQINKDVISL